LSKPRALVTSAAVICALATLLVTVLPFLSFAYRSEGAHVAIETAASIIAALAALVVVSRFARSHQLSDLLLSAALLLMAATNLVFSTVPSISYSNPSTFEVWAPLGGRTLAAAVLTAAAFAPDRTVRRTRRALVRAGALIFTALSLIAILAVALESALPRVIDSGLSPESSGRPRVVGPIGLLVSYALLTVMYAVAAVGFTRRAERAHDELMTWFAAGTAVAAFSRLNYFLFPSIYSEWVYTGDVLRLAFYLLLFVGAAREIAAYHGQLAVTAVLEERGRMARDLHDGLAQELAFIASQSHRLRDGPRGDIAALVGQAAERALDESRTVIAALARPPDDDVSEAIAHMVRGLAARRGADVTLDLDPKARATPAEREALARIAGEAVNNAVHHGATRLWVTLQAEKDKLRLTIRDDGEGFDVAAVESSDGGGFGLRSMRERARSLGGELQIDSAPGRGATVAVQLR